MEKLKSAKGLGDASSDEEERTGAKKSTSAEIWVQKQKEKEEARKKEKLLEEMDRQYEAVETTEKKKNYNANHLKGLKVEHDQSYFKEGHDVILTLKDRSIIKGSGTNIDLDEDEEADVLVNVNIMDDERALENNENKKKKPDYNPYDDEFDEDGSFKQRSILEKYNEELNGTEKKSFKLGAKGMYDASDERFEVIFFINVR